VTGEFIHDACTAKYCLAMKKMERNTQWLVKGILLSYWRNTIILVHKHLTEILLYRYGEFNCMHIHRPLLNR